MKKAIIIAALMFLCAMARGDLINLTPGGFAFDGANPGYQWLVKTHTVIDSVSPETGWLHGR